MGISHGTRSGLSRGLLLPHGSLGIRDLSGSSVNIGGSSIDLDLPCSGGLRRGAHLAASLRGRTLSGRKLLTSRVHTLPRICQRVTPRIKRSLVFGDRHRIGSIRVPSSRHRERLRLRKPTVHRPARANPHARHGVIGIDHIHVVADCMHAPAMRSNVAVHFITMLTIKIESSLSRKARRSQRSRSAVKDGLLLIDPLDERIASVVPRHVFTHVELLSMGNLGVGVVRVGNGGRHHVVRHLELAQADALAVLVARLEPHNRLLHVGQTRRVNLLAHLGKAGIFAVEDQVRRIVGTHALKERDGALAVVFRRGVRRSLGSVEPCLCLSHSLVSLLLLSFRLVERLVGSVLLVLGSQELGLSVGQRRERIGMLGLSLVNSSVGRGRSSRGRVQFGLRVNRCLLLDGERLLSSLHLTLGSGHFLRGSSELAFALRLDRLGGAQRGSGGVHLGLGSLVLRARGTLLGTVEIGLGGVIACLRSIHIFIGRVLCPLSLRELALRVLLFGRGGINASLGTRKPSLSVSRLLLGLRQLARSLISCSLGSGHGLGRGIGCGSLGSLKRSPSIV